MSSLPTPPRLGLRVPLPPPPREGGTEDAGDELRPGDLLEGRYQIEDRLGEGGVGFVYRARQIKLHRRVAIKLLQQDVMGDEELRPRFEREALTLAALSHPNIVSLNDYGAIRGRPYLVMELLEGRTLREVIDRDGPMEFRRALMLLRQVVLALAYAHSLGIVHRDLKPANLLVQSLPCHEHLKVLDFGLVKLIPGSHLDRGVQLSRVGFTFGTPAYMSPEHAVGGEVDGRSDLYAAGVLLFELLSGQKPFDGELQDILRAHFQAPVPKLWDRKPELKGRDDLQAFIERAMAKERDDRFPDAAAMIAAIDALLTPSAASKAVTQQVPVLQVERPSMQAGAARVSAVLIERTRVTWTALRTHGGPLLQKVGNALRTGAVRSFQISRSSSQQAYVWLKPRALRLSEKVAERARDLKTQLAERAQRSMAPKPLQLPVQDADDDLRQAPEDAELLPSSEPATSLQKQLKVLANTDADATVVDEPLEEPSAAAVSERKDEPKKSGAESG